MKEYFRLQQKLLNRKMIQFGISPYIGYSLIPIAFILVSTYLFSKTEYACYLISVLAISIVSKLSDSRRNDFLKTIFNRDNYFKIRILENLICILPFLLILAYKGYFLLVVATTILSIVMASFNFNTKIDITIPTPFGKKPFEFLVGFRKTFYIFPIAYFLTYQSISAENFNLGIFSMLLICFTCMSYYSKPENEYFVWNYSLTPKAFIFEKAKIALLNFTLLSLPILLFLGYHFIDQPLQLIVAYLVCLAYLLAFILAKYSAFPNEMDVSVGLLIGISVLFPPLLLFIIPAFYSQSIKKLKPILE